MKIYSHLESTTLTNQYLVINEDTKEGILIDVPAIDTWMISHIEKAKINLRAVLLTHTHENHAGGLGTIFKIYSPEVYSFIPRIGDRYVREVHDGERLSIAGLGVEAIHVPGHSLDSICWKIGNALFTGDTLLSGEVGGTQGLIEKEVLIKGINEKLMSLDDNTLIYPGHGPLTRVRIERYFNQDLLEGNLFYHS